MADAEAGTDGVEDMDPPGEGTGEGAEKRSSGRPELVMLLVEADEEEPAAALALTLSEGRDNPPSPDIGVSSSANASNEIRSAAFLLGLWLHWSQMGRL